MQLTASLDPRCYFLLIHYYYCVYMCVMYMICVHDVYVVCMCDVYGMCVHDVYDMCVHDVYDVCMHDVYDVCVHDICDVCMHDVYDMCMCMQRSEGFCSVSSLLPLLCALWGSSSGHQACSASITACWPISSLPLLSVFPSLWLGSPESKVTL